jgi:PPOX class probable F420-dependent enzyme
MAESLNDQDLKLLQSKNFAHLTTLGPDGSPRTTVMWVDCSDGDVVLNTSHFRSKVADVRRNPRVAVSVHDQENPYCSVNISGVVEIDEANAEADTQRLSQKYIGKAFPDEWRMPGERRITLRVRPERIHRYGYQSPGSA